LRIYCSNCGLKVDPEDVFCSGCGKELKSKPENDESERCTLTSEKISFAEHVNYPDKNSKSRANLPGKNIWIIGLICALGFIITVFSTFVLVSGQHPYGISSAAHNKFQEKINIEICEQIAAEYYKSHSYAEDDIYDCDNMAQDIWNMLKAKDINARIAVGNFDPGVQNKIEDGKPILKKLNSGSPGEIKPYNYTYDDSGRLNSSTIDNLTHAWTLAEISPDSWLAIECTGGYVVYSEEDENYYRCLTFNNPKDYRSFLELYRSWKKEIIDYEDERSYYNKFAETYNNASYSEQLAMKSSVETAQVRLQEKKKVLLKTDSELMALLQSG
jgi:hypothetical protein